MAFWLFFTAMDLLIPGIMVGIGTRFLKHPPGTINAWYGYRTARSMKNQETWDFAHETCGRLWVRLGKLSFLPALLAAVLTFGRGIETVSVASIVVVPPARWACMARTKAASSPSRKSAPAPPWTCRSTKPGVRYCPFASTTVENVCCGETPHPYAVIFPSRLISQASCST